MSNTYSVARSHIIYGLCLPLAVILGYIWASPMDKPGLSFLFIVAAVLCVPLLMRWYHPLTIFSWNAVFYLGFLPGQMPLWFFCACAGFVIVLLNRSLDSKRRMLVEPGVAWPLLIVGAVVLLTAHFTGGISTKAFGSEAYGGRKYFYVLGAIPGYFVLASQRIPEKKAGWYVAIFFLAGLTGFLGDLIYMAGPGFYPLFNVIPTGSAIYMAEASQGLNEDGLVRIAGFSATQAACVYLLARYGLRGILSKPWRLALVLLFIVMGLYSGFRTFLIGVALIFMAAFFIEKVYRTRYMLLVIVLGGLCGLFLFAFASRLPLSVQRTICFLPVDVNPEVRMSAQSSVDWRLEMWDYLLPEVSDHLWKGKGYRLDPGELMMADQNSSRGFGIAAENSMLAEDYHNGPLSVLIPFGVWGMAAFLWFIIAIIVVLCRNCARGDPALLNINHALLACCVGKIVMFFLIYGDFSADLAWFVGIVGFSVSLNGESRSKRTSSLPARQPQMGFHDHWTASGTRI